MTRPLIDSQAAPFRGSLDTFPRHMAPRVRSMIAAILNPFRSGRTYLRIAYLLIAFPLATAYFVVVVTGLTTGLGLAIVFIGLPLLALTLGAWVMFGRLERVLAIHMLGARVGPTSPIRPAGSTLAQSATRMLADPVTWKSLAYVLLEFPFAIFSFTLTIVMLTTSVAFAVTPIAWAVAWLIDPGFPVDAFQDSTGFFGPRFAHAAPPEQALVLLGTAIFGLLLLAASIALLNGIAIAWGRFAGLMLGADESRVQLQAARAELDVEHARAEEADRSRRELIVNASHELRTPVASISAHVESLLKPERKLDEETRRYLTVVGEETERLGALVEDVLVLARADAGELKLNVRPVDAGLVVSRVCETLAPFARRERNLSLVTGPVDHLPQAMADEDRLGQVLANLVRNAVNNTPDGGIISVDAKAADGRVEITVSDTGIGMEQRELTRIFERFYRIDEARDRDSGGTGLGLSIVRNLLEAMGATVDAQSTPGKGSVFTVSLRQAMA